MFSVDAAAVVDWSLKVMTGNMTYFRLRRELFEEFSRLLNPPPGRVTSRVSSESFIVIRYFLTARNESLDDNKRFSFDKAILQLREDALIALAAVPPPPGGVAGLLGFGRQP